MKPVPVPPASGPMNGAHSPAALTCAWSSAISASAASSSCANAGSFGTTCASMKARTCSLRSTRGS